MRLTYLSIVSCIALCVVFTSCKKETVKKELRLGFVFLHSAGNDSLSFDTIKYTNAAGNKYGVSTLKYFLSDFELVKTDGSKVVFDETIYVDAGDSLTNGFVPASLASSGEYQSLSFVFGLNEEKNVTGSFPNPPENKMEWPIPLGGGYHYMKLEGKFDSAGMVKNYQAHFGRLMETPHFINITLPFTYSLPEGGTATVYINMDVNKWWETPNTFDLNIMSGIMNNEAIQQQLQENGADIFSVDHVLSSD